MATAAAAITVDQFVRMDEAETCELVDGELVQMASATPLHGITRDHLVQLARNYFDGNAVGGVVGETDCRIGEDTVRRPDVSFFLGDAWKQLDFRKVPVPRAPDIAAEVLSPSEQILDVTRKVREYLAAGSQEVWLLDPDNGEIQIRTRSGIRILEGPDKLETPLLPGFSVAVDKLLSL